MAIAMFSPLPGAFSGSAPCASSCFLPILGPHSTRKWSLLLLVRFNKANVANDSSFKNGGEGDGSIDRYKLQPSWNSVYILDELRDGITWIEGMPGIVGPHACLLTKIGLMEG